MNDNLPYWVTLHFRDGRASSPQLVFLQDTPLGLVNTQEFAFSFNVPQGAEDTFEPGLAYLLRFRSLDGSHEFERELAH